MKTYVVFLLGTFAAALAIYLPMKKFLGPAGPYFLLTAAGQVHFIMAYFWSVPTYKKWPAKIIVENLTLFTCLGTLLYLAFYAFPVLNGNEIWLIVILIAVLHFARDYRYFLNQISSGFLNHERSLAWTMFLASLFFAVYFGILLRSPEQQALLFPYEDKVSLFWYQAIFVLAVITFLASLAVIGSTVRRLSFLAAPKNFLSFGAFALPGSVLPLIQSMTLLDMILFVAFWHLVQWDGFTMMKINERTKRPRENIQQVERAPGLFERIHRLWGRSVTHYAGITALYDALVLGPFFVMIAFGVYPTFSAAVYQNFFWGLEGYALFSPLHFVFTALLAHHAKKAALSRS